MNTDTESLRENVFNLLLPLEWKAVEGDQGPSDLFGPWKATVFHPGIGKFLFFGRVRHELGQLDPDPQFYFRRLEDPKEKIGPYNVHGTWTRCGYTGKFREGEDYVMVKVKESDAEKLLQGGTIERCHQGFCAKGLLDGPGHRELLQRWH